MGLSGREGGRGIGGRSCYFIRVIYPSHESRRFANRDVMLHSSRLSESSFRVFNPSLQSESSILVIYPSHLSESSIRVIYPSRTSASPHTSACGRSPSAPPSASHVSVTQRWKAAQIGHVALGIVTCRYKSVTWRSV
jgi:hypothetical protein